MVALAKAHEEKTGIKIELEGGATRGIPEVAASTADIGGSCRRRIFGAEEECGVIQVPVAWDALAVIVDKANPVQNISLDDLRKVDQGQIRNWSELGGVDAPIELLVRKISCVGRTTRKLLFENYDQEFAASAVFESTGPLEEAVTKQPNAIAISRISSAGKRDLKILELNGKYPSYENVQNGDYLLYRVLYLVYNEASPNAAQIEDFIQFADSEEGRAVIRRNGTVPYLEGLNPMKNKLEASRQARRDSGLQ